ncbi:NAD(P)/FAD-dependent oxidoreductase [Hyphomicrobium sp.]|uniref:NAD(P)/FAD-dependent oxidoreductase n=1 Tax=Hyphomicrobium sp. TaxID=82 RepID=UPI002E34363D|nr:NAD(P)/FAD-dependent oxidoreductase [Hyphomicrobium sp.]HEX2840352.1 NAD(P)/FAD-dependent oxidoreductase [Hyphomicrobium sp.]
MATTDVESVVIGAGVVGLGIARALAAAGHDVLVLERHDGIGQETSSRSSEVIHAGLYYPRGSLKAKLCVAGRDLLYAFAAENGVPHRRVGKLVVATDPSELDRLDALARTALDNGVSDLTRLTAAEVRALEPEIASVGALLSPSTGVIDSHALMVALEGHLSAAGGSIVLNTAVDGILAGDVFRLITTSDGQRSELSARNLVIAAGLGASRLGRMVARERYEPPQVYASRGHYFTLDGRAPFHHLVYPLPQPGFLGVHLTLDVAGQARFGPDLEWSDAPNERADYTFDDGGGARLACFEADIRRYWPDLPEGRLSPGYVGVRPKIYRRGDAVPDFAIHDTRVHGVPRLVALYGIESPGLTSSLAIGDYVAEMLAK